MKITLLTLTVLAFTAVPAVAQSTVLCESMDGKYRECRLEGVGVATLTRQMSDNQCIEGQTWGYRDGRIWVDRGCRGQFALTSRAASAPLDTRITCESQNGQLNRCAVDTAAGVRLARRISDAGCEFGRDWGYDRNGIWVTNGCRAEFAVTSSTFASAPLAGTSVVTCESVDNRRANCRADTRYGVELRRQLSDANCIRNSTWGVTDDGIWVSSGCRGEFVVSDRYAVASTAPIGMAGTNTLLCESIDGRRNHCRADTTYGALLSRQISDSSCRFGTSWGIDNNGIWVTNGCRGEFALGDARLIRTGMISSSPSAAAPTLTCESVNNGHQHCRADTRFGVTLLRQLSDTECVRNRNWGVDDLGVWVTGGCRGEFVLDRR